MSSNTANLAANKKILQRIKLHIHMLKQGRLPPDIASQALLIFKDHDKAVAGMLAARERDKANVEHIIQTYEEGRA